MAPLPFQYNPSGDSSGDSCLVVILVVELAAMADELRTASSIPCKLEHDVTVGVVRRRAQVIPEIPR